jgi:hypothetical protein
LAGSEAIYVDNTPAIEMDFSERCDQLTDAISDDASLYTEAGIDINAYQTALDSFRDAGENFLQKAKDINARYEAAVASNESIATIESIRKEGTDLNKQSLVAYQYLQDKFLGMGGDGEVYIFHQIVQDNIDLLTGVLDALQTGSLGKALGLCWQINGGTEYIAYNFSQNTSLEALKTRFCDYDQDTRAYGKRIGRVDTYPATYALVNGTSSEGYTDEIALYHSERAKLLVELKNYIDSETNAMNQMVDKLDVAD